MLVLVLVLALALALARLLLVLAVAACRHKLSAGRGQWAVRRSSARLAATAAALACSLARCTAALGAHVLDRRRSLLMYCCR